MHAPDKKILESFRGKKIAVIGDVMLDRFIEGVVTKKSPEANAPVVLWQKENNVLGGAANVVANVKTLGGFPELFSVIGTDATGKDVVRLLKKSKITHRLIVDKERITTLKIRIFADNKYFLRLDKEIRNPVSKTITVKLLKQISQKISSFDAIIFSDYDKGIFSSYLAQSIIALARKHKVPIIADVKPNNFLWFKGVNLIKPNIGEAILMGGTSDLPLVGKNISHKLGCDVLITLGSKGMLLYQKGSKQHETIRGIKTRPKDIVGAGDVVLACLSLGIASGEALYKAASLANIAAALSVEKHGTSAVSLEEVSQHLAYK